MTQCARTRFDDLVRFDRQRRRRRSGCLAGVDEAGRGALAGPVVAAAVVCEPCEELGGVRDSKQLSENVRERLYEALLSRSVCLSTGIVWHDEIDRVNILQATLAAMRIAVEGLDAVPALVLVDGIAAPPLQIDCETVTGGDRLSFSIAAASIVAKVTRDRIMRGFDGDFPLYGFPRNKGYGTRMHRAALARFGPCPIHRRSFRFRADGA